MRSFNRNFENKNIDFEKLSEYGFVNDNGIYAFEKNIYDNNFKVIVEISKEKQISRVMDLSLNEEYVLADVANSTGEFVGQIKEEYESILNDIIEKCTVPDVFKSKQAKEIIKYVKEKYNDDLEYLWQKFPDNAVLRNKENNKWYAALMVLSERKLGIASDKTVDIIDLRYQKDAIEEITDNKKVFKGYHMNKNNWITIRLDESMTIKEIFELTDNSYKLSLKK